jgi:hypothetical protein
MDFDFLSSNLHIAYPFRDSVDVGRPSGVENVNGLVAALRVYTYEQREANLFLDAIHLRTEDGFITLHTAKIDLRWSDGTTVSLEAGVNAVARSVAYGAWIVVTVRHTTEDIVFHIVFPVDVTDDVSSSSSLSGSSDGPDLVFRFWKQTDDIEILSSLVKLGPKKIKNIYAKQGSTLTKVAGPGQEFSVQPGFNMEIEQGAASVEDTGRKLTRVAINAVPGSGLGKYLICRGDEYLFTLNGVGPDDNGNLKLGPEECYWLDIPIKSGPTPLPNPSHNIARSVILEPNQVRLRNACGPCCSCDDYIKAYDHLRQIWNKARAVAESVNGIRDGYASLVQQLAAKQPQDDILFIAQNGMQLVVQVTVWNNSEEATTGETVITLEFSLPDGVTFNYAQSVVAGLGDPRYMVPEDVDTTPNVTVEDELRAYQVFWWNTTWTLAGIDVGDELTVTATISESMDKSETEELTWADLGG